MKKTKVIGITLIITFAVLSTSSALVVSERLFNLNTAMISSDVTQVYLGSASIYGTGNDSVLSATALNNILIGIEAKEAPVDFYIDYEMNCTGVTDEGAISLSIFLNDQNVSLQAIQTPNKKSGRLVIENVTVNRGDSLLFIINVAYGNLIPLYSNSTSDTGVGVISHSNAFRHPLLRILELFPCEFYRILYDYLRL